MVIELGHYALVLAFLVAILQSVVPLWGAYRNRLTLMTFGRQAAISFFWLVTIALLALAHAYALSDFSVLNVAQNSHTMKPPLYKIAALWGNHEGSMLLWVWILSLWACVYARRTAASESRTFENRTFDAYVLSVLGMMSAGFAIYVLIASNPFIRLDPPAPEGMSLNPVLQDPLLVIHPPLLYMGYVGFAACFSLAAAALLRGKVDAELAKIMRPYTLAAWVCLTGGIALGSFWAYYELGWGGFWFWDPVENSSLLPWLAGTALFHSLLVLEKRGTLKNWTIFLAILTFSLSLLGTFLVRSGVLTSVHSFAADPLRGVFILALLALYTGGALALYAARGGKIETGAGFALVSRETMLVLNNVFLFTFTVTILTGTLYPVLSVSMGGDSVSVGAPYFVAVMTPLMPFFAFLMGAVTVVNWGAATPPRALMRLIAPAAVLAAVCIAFFILVPDVTFLLMLGLVSSLWIMAAGVADFYRKRALKSLPVSFLAMHLAHAGLALLIVGASFATQKASEKILYMSPGDKIEIAGRMVSFRGAETAIGSNYNIDRGIFDIDDKGEMLRPEKRWYPVSQKMTSEASLLRDGLGILYIVMGDQDEKNPARWVVRIYHHPLLLLIYIGAALMAAGGALAALSKGRVTL